MNLNSTLSTLLSNITGITTAVAALKAALTDLETFLAANL